MPILKRYSAAAGALLLGILACELVLYEVRLYQGNALWRAALDEANEARALLESRVNTAAAEANGVAIYVTAVEGQIEEDSLQRVLEEVYASGDYFRNIGLAPGNRIEYIYPLAGNEAVLGLQYETLPAQWPVIRSMIEQREGRLAGPLELVQGGSALLYREPIFVDDAYWGLLSSVINSDQLLATLDPLIENRDINIALRGSDAMGENGSVFVGDPATFDQAEEFLDIFVPGGSWQMAIEPTAEPFPLTPLQRTGLWLTCAALIGGLLLGLRAPFQQRAVNRLEKAVQERTDRLAQTNSLLSSVLDSARDFAIIATDPSGTITLFSRGAESMLGYTAADVTGTATPARFHDRRELMTHAERRGLEPTDEVQQFQALVANLSPGQTDIGEWTYRRHNGTTLPVWLVLSAITDASDRVIGYLSIATDLTERKQTEQLKSEFIATVSHELRTPVTALIGALALLRGGYQSQLSAEALGLVHLAERNGERLQALIQDLLDIQQMELGRLSLKSERVSLADQLTMATELADSMARKKAITLSISPVEASVRIAVDSRRFQQVLGNLLSNAIKFAPEHSTVRISTGWRSGMSVVRVADEGPGIPDAFRPQLFRKFSQVDSGSTRQSGGTGLGLAISQELMQRMGGWIDYEPAPGGGALFSVAIPLARDHWALGAADTAD